MKVVLVEVVPDRRLLTMELVPPLGLGFIASVLVRIRNISEAKNIFNFARKYLLAQGRKQ